MEAINVGRYISGDPIGIDGGLNLYNYAAVNPVMNIDPEGLAPNPLELACAAGPNPVCIAGVAADAITWIAGGVGLAAMMSLSGDTPQCNANTAAGDKPSAAACSKAIKLLEQRRSKSGDTIPILLTPGNPGTRT